MKSSLLRRRLTAIVLTGSLMIVNSPKSQATAIVLLPVGAIVVGAIVLAGVTYWQVAYPDGTTTTYGYDTTFQIDEGDESEIYIADEVFGDNYAEAARRCQALANEWGVEFIKVARIGSSKRWECHVRS
jgi:hypothetical protein